MTVALIVPVMTNFHGFTKLMHSIDFPVLPLIQNNWDSNLGVAVAWNNGLRAAVQKGCEYAIISNDDVVLFRNAVPSLCRYVDDQRIVASAKSIMGEAHPRGINYWCFAVRPAEFIDKVGFFDENFTPAYFEDDDMAYRIKLAGHESYNTSVEAYHAVSGTQHHRGLDDPVVKWDDLQKNVAYYREKWGGDPGSEVFTHPYNDETKTWRDWNAYIG
jgi:GT2 family glycosyltransferase